MGIYIKGMKMPKCCDVCIFSGWSNLHQTAACKICEYNPCFDKFSKEYLTKRANFCPLVEVPIPHGGLIDADATMKQWRLNNATKYGNKTAEQQHFSYSTMMMYEIADILDDAPVVIEAEGELWKN